MRVSRTARQEGFSPTLYKSVKGLSKEEKIAVETGEIVGFKSERLSRGTTGTDWRIVHFRKIGPRKYYFPRVPSAKLLEELEALETKNIQLLTGNDFSLVNEVMNLYQMSCSTAERLYRNWGQGFFEALRDIKIAALNKGE